jgi:hypothetical protein
MDMYSLQYKQNFLSTPEKKILHTRVSEIYGHNLMFDGISKFKLVSDEVMKLSELIESIAKCVKIGQSNCALIKSTPTKSSARPKTEYCCYAVSTIRS